MSKDKNIVEIPAQNIVKDLFLIYAEETITSRALIKVQDGLKPVQRYILYAMYEMGLKNSGLTRKCARIAGQVIGNYSAHGLK